MGRRNGGESLGGGGAGGGVEGKCKKYFLHLLLHKLSQFSQLQCH